MTQSLSHIRRFFPIPSRALVGPFPFMGALMPYSGKTARATFCLSLLAMTGLSGIAVAAPMTKATNAGKAGYHTGAHTRRPVHVSTRGKGRSAAAHKVRHLDATSPESFHITASRNTSSGSEMRVGQTVMKQFVPGTTPFKILAARTPGVMFNTSDALGLSSWGATMFVRGFFWSNLGVSVDDIPLNDQAYASVSGLQLSQAVITDDIAGMSVSQGGGALDVMSSSNLGGSINVQTRAPSDKRGADVQQTFGSNGSYRTFVRLDSGKLNDTGTKFSVSYVRSDTQKWKGYGHQFAQQAEAKLVQPIGHSSSITAFMNWSQSEQWSYSDLSLATLKSGQWDTDYLYPNYRLAYRQAQGLDGGVGSYYDGGIHQVSYLGGLTADFALTDRLRWKTTAYGNSSTTYTNYGDPSQSSQVLPGATEASPISEEVWIPQSVRYGIVSSLHYNIARHTIASGLWLETNSQQMGQYFFNEPSLASGDAPLKAIGPFNTYGRAFITANNFRWNTNTFQYFLGDTYRPTKNLKIQAGFKSMIVTTAGGAQVNDSAVTGQSALASGSMTASSAFLPHVAVNWKFAPGHELYFDVAENMRAYAVQSWGGASIPSLWAVENQALFRKLQHTTKPEKSWVYLVGYRYTNPYVSATIDAYHANDYNHLYDINSGTRTNPIVSVMAQDISMYGADGGLTLTPFHHGIFKGVSLYNSISYNHSTFGKDITSAGTTYAVSGKKIPNYPQLMYKSSLSYSYKGAEVHLDANYMSKRYYSYTNDTSVPHYWLVSMGARYRFGDFGVMKNLTASFNIYNLTNVKYVSGTGDNGNPMSGDLYSLQRGAPRQFFGTLSAHF